MRAKLASLALALALFAALSAPRMMAQVVTPVPEQDRGQADAERSGFLDAANLRTVFWNYGMVGDYPPDPGRVDLSTFHSVEVPKGSGMNYSDGITPFVLAKVRQRDGREVYIMETGFRERQDFSPYQNRIMRFEPRPGYIEPDPLKNPAKSPAISKDPRTWPAHWPDKDASWDGSWNGYFGKRAAADQESFSVMDDNFYDAWDFRPDSRDSTRHGLGLRIEVRGFQWANPQASNVIFWHYDVTNEGTTDYDNNIIFGLYMDSGVGGSALSCDQIYESDDDNAYFNRTFDQQVINLVYTWDKRGHGRSLASSCGPTGYLGYAYLETPGNGTDHIDNDQDGIIDEVRDGGEGTEIPGKDAIRAYVTSQYNMERFTTTYGALENRPAYKAGVWWTGDEDMDWNPELHDLGQDGLPETGDAGESNGQPDPGEPNFDRTDLNESDQIGLTGFKMNRIKAGADNPDQTTDGILFYTEQANWPQRLYEQFTSADSTVRFGPAIANNYNIGFLFASGPFRLEHAKSERFSLALAYGADLNELRRTVRTVQQIYDTNYQFAVPPTQPTATAESGSGWVRLSWDTAAERGADPVTGEQDFEGYRIYRSTDPEFRDPRVVTTGTGSGPLGNGRPSAQFDLNNGRNGYSALTVEGVSYYLGNDTGLTHTWSDSTVTNGQEYFYAVCAYDHGSDSLQFYPSENAITVSRTLRGGLILPSNVVQVRPEPKALGYIGASAADFEHAQGRGSGPVEIAVVNSNVVRDGHLFKIRFTAPAPDSIRANTYALVDSTEALRDPNTHGLLFKGATDLTGQGVGPVGAGLLPVITTRYLTTADTVASAFAPGSASNAKLNVTYQAALPGNLYRPGFPDDISIVFSSTVLDTSLVDPIDETSTPAKFKALAHSDGGDRQLDFFFYDADGNRTLNRTDEYIDLVTYAASSPGVPSITWRVRLNSQQPNPLRAPTDGDVYEVKLTRPYAADDVLVFTGRGQRIDTSLAQSEAPFQPYVVPNPYVGSASFEPERFAVSGRGERRIEFRGLPSICTIRIYTVRGELVQTLRNEGSVDGAVGWNLRSKDNLDVAPGLYLFHVEGQGVGHSIGKFSIIK